MKRKRQTESELYLTNTLTGRKEVFKCREDKKVKIFTCGPSVYRRPHVGNYRTFLYEDILQRYLEYLGYEVERVINFTDVEDKTIAEAQQEEATLDELTRPVVEQFFKDTSLLSIKLPDFIPRSSTSVEQAVELIKILLEKGYAYWYEKDVFFDPLKFKGFGKLFGLDMSRWPKGKRRFRKDTYPGQRWNLGDFILWHGYKGEKKESFYWETEIGKGRPAWNIQDPAIITKHLGYRIDISCGGVDNLYRHHDYNLAVIESVAGEEFAHYWLHGEHVFSDGAKMSKSKGNIVYPDDLLEQGYGAKQIRFYLIYGHYRKRINLTAKSLQEKSRKLDAFTDTVQELTRTDVEGGPSLSSIDEHLSDLIRSFENHMNDDLDVEGAFDAVHDKVSELEILGREEKLSRHDTERIHQTLKNVDRVLRVLYP